MRRAAISTRSSIDGNGAEQRRRNATRGRQRTVSTVAVKTYPAPRSVWMSSA